MEQKQRKGTTVHQSTGMRKNSRVKVSSNFPHKKLALNPQGVNKIYIKTDPSQKTSIRVKGRKVKIRRA